MFFPRFYQETINEIKNGKWGEEIQKFLIENPDAAFNVERVFGLCPNCGEYENTLDLTMYLPKENISQFEKDNHGRWSVAFPFSSENYVTEWDLKKYYKRFSKYPHKCKNCGSQLKIINEGCFSRYHEEFNNLKCPRCKSFMINSGFGSWD